MDFYNNYNPQPVKSNNTLLFLFLFVLLLSCIAGGVAYWKYDDIIVLFEKPSVESIPATAGSETMTESSPATAGSETMTESSPATAASQTTTESSPSAAETDEYTTTGTKNLGETCETDNDCKSSEQYPMVCQTHQSGSTKQCKKLPGMNYCYKDQCNRYLMENLKNRFSTVGLNGRERYQSACHKCNPYRVNTPNLTNANPSRYSNNGHININGKPYPKTQYGQIDYKQLYQELCFKEEDGSCNPSTSKVNRLTGEIKPL